MPRRKKCRACNEPFSPTYSSTQVVCSPKCAIEYQTTKEGKDHVKRERKRENRKRKQSLRDTDRSAWIKKAQASFNKFIRLRDRQLPCVSCGTENRTRWNAGHFHPAGRSSALRFDESNVHKQCVPCNQHKSGHLSEYRVNIVARIGQAELDRLDAEQHTLKRWEIDELREIKQRYDRKIKELSDEAQSR